MSGVLNYLKKFKLCFKRFEIKKRPETIGRTVWSESGVKARWASGTCFVVP